MVVSADVSDGTANVGNTDALVPYVDLGIPLAEALDPWGLRYRYKPNSAVISPGIGSLAPAAGIVATSVFIIALIATFFLPEPKPEQLPE